MIYKMNIKNFKIQNFSKKNKFRLFDEEVFKLHVHDDEIVNMTERNLRSTQQPHFKKIYH